jgi:hypothetical protein
MARRFAPAAALLAVALPVFAATPVADVALGVTSVEWRPLGDFAGAQLRVSGPAGIEERSFAEGAMPFFDLRELAVAEDGLYTWELVMSPRLDAGARRELAAARAEGDTGAEGRLRSAGALPPAESMIQSGHFRVLGGSIFQPTGEAEPAAPGQRRVTAAAGPRPVTADVQVINMDLIVQGSICAGLDCTSGESFSFDTIRLKENNTRIDFTDTSVGTFPSTDWELTANDSASGGQNRFSIMDSTTSRIPFTVEGGATTNSIYVDSTGRVGFRTSTPVLDLHVATGNTPGIRLEQNTSSGFTAQSWDIAGNETNFFVRDVTGGSLLSFRIRPGAPSSSIDIASDGDVGVGTASPAARLHIAGTASPKVLIADTTDNADDKPGFTLRSPAAASSGDWVFETDNAGNFQIDFGPSPGPELLISDATGTNGAVTINGNLTVNGVFANPSSRALKEAFEPVDVEEVLAKITDLQIHEWTYKTDPEGRRHVGPTAEDFLAVFGLGSDGKYVYPIDLQGITMAAVQGLSAKVANLETVEAREKDAEIAALKQRVSVLEDQIRALLESR